MKFGNLEDYPSSDVDINFGRGRIVDNETPSTEEKERKERRKGRRGRKREL